MYITGFGLASDDHCLTMHLGSTHVVMQLKVSIPGSNSVACASPSLSQCLCCWQGSKVHCATLGTTCASGSS